MSFDITTRSGPILRAAHEQLGWPEPQAIFFPQGVATRLTAELADQKIGRALRVLSGDDSIQVGVMASNPDSTEAPLAIVCVFSRPASGQVLLEAQRLAWNFSRSLLLLTIEPHLIRKWSCYEKPKSMEELFPLTSPQSVNGFGDVIGAEQDNLGDGEALDGRQTAQILPALMFDEGSTSFSNMDEAFSLSWIDLLSGAFFARERSRFKVTEKADQVLLENLTFAREQLRTLGLENKWSHDLLARIIFVQFLFDRKDSKNRAALDSGKLAQLQSEGVVQGHYENLAQLLDSYEDTYALFRWLNDRFNGDLFPGKGDTAQEREADWQSEQENVRPHHLQLLARFVRGDLEMKKGQYCLWRQYAFDAIPLELISSIYEEFVTNAKSAHYTPGHLVDLMLDRVLPWESEHWDCKILDPSCGSGIFLVKAYQRLIHRWKRASGLLASDDTRREIPAAVLRQLLENNLFGVDEHVDAIRVASFSLYLAMCDEIDPRHYWSDEDRVRFPALRGRTLWGRDFFDETTPGFRTQEDAGTYDLVVGNPPWGDKTASEAATLWANAYNWQVANKDFGVLFAAKGMELTKPGGFVCMVQSAGAVLYNRETTAQSLQQHLFSHWKQVNCVVNLSAFRELKLFKAARSTSCVLIFQNLEPDGTPFWYECPKPFHTPEDTGRITVDLNEMHSVYPDEVRSEPWIWSALMWGGARDRALLRKVGALASLEGYLTAGQLHTREGVSRGNQKKQQPELVGRRIVLDFPSEGLLSLDSTLLPRNDNPNIDSGASTRLEAFSSPQLIIKRSWIKEKKRFQSRIIRTERENGTETGALCSKIFISAHLPPAISNTDVFVAAALAYNSCWANYFMLLTSGRFAFGRPQPLSGELRSLPLPLLSDNDTLDSQRAEEFRALVEADAQGQHVTLEAIDEAVFRAFEFQKAERILIEDLVEHTLSGFKERSDSLTYQPTKRHSDAMEEPDLRRYCEALSETLANAYGADKALAIRIWSETSNAISSHFKTIHLPLRYISVVFGVSSERGVQIHPLGDRVLRERILSLYNQLQAGRDGGYGRQLRDYSAFEFNGESGLVLNILKPDQLRYWTRSVALRDADEIARDFWIWQHGSAPDSGTTYEQPTQIPVAQVAYVQEVDKGESRSC